LGVSSNRIFFFASLNNVLPLSLLSLSLSQAYSSAIMGAAKLEEFNGDNATNITAGACPPPTLTQIVD
jgi:hypothetical protein